MRVHLDGQILHLYYQTQMYVCVAGRLWNNVPNAFEQIRITLLMTSDFD